MRRLVVERPPSLAALWSRRLGLFALAVMAIAVALSWLGRIDPAAALAVLGLGLLLATIGAVLAFVAFVAIWNEGRPGFGKAVAGLMLAVLLAAYPAFLAVQALRLPRLNDISTDIADPPSFSRSRRALDLRAGRVPPEVPQPVRAAQKAAYPQVQPVVLDLTPQESFALVQKAASQRGWQVIETATPGGRVGTGRLEAIDHSLAMRFPEDVTVRLRPTAAGTRIDIRSASRFPIHDFGANARRIAAFAEAVQELADAR